MRLVSGLTKHRWLVVAAIIMITVVVFAVTVKNDQKEIGNMTTYRLNGKTLHLLVADRPAEWEKGLMNIRQKTNFDGILFRFPDKAYRNFWNKNTLLDLNIYWLVDEQVIRKDFLPAITRGGLVTITSPQPVNRVIEIIN